MTEFFFLETFPELLSFVIAFDANSGFFYICYK